MVTNSQKSLINDLFDSFSIKSCLPLEPTRHFKNSESAIDYIVSNIEYINSSNIDIEYSDHKMQVCIFKTNYVTAVEKPCTVWKRDLSDNNLHNLNFMLSRTDFSQLYQIHDPQEAYNYFWGLFYFCFDVSCPKN